MLLSLPFVRPAPRVRECALAAFVGRRGAAVSRVARFCADRAYQHAVGGRARAYLLLDETLVRRALSRA
eukprot:5880598-Pleurochrysis_carterae.AAC.2